MSWIRDSNCWIVSVAASISPEPICSCAIVNSRLISEKSIPVSCFSDIAFEYPDYDTCNKLLDLADIISDTKFSDLEKLA